MSPGALHISSVEAGAVDTLLAERVREHRAIRVGMVGAGAAGRAIARHLVSSVPGVRLVAIANRTITRAHEAFAAGGVATSREVRAHAALDAAIEQGECAVTSDAEMLTDAAAIDVVIEATGTVEYAARIVTGALERRKHVVLVNAELDATLGPLLARRAKEFGVVLTNTDGDEPGVAMTLLRYLRSLGLRPVAAGNLKGMVDHYRTPETQRAFSEKFGQNPWKATSFADATKLSLEATILANATGFRVGKRGMYGPSCAHVNELAALLPRDEMLERGLVDYALGAAPYTGAFVIVHEDDAAKRGLFAYGKLGDGPFFVFHTPFHLPHVQIASTIARAVLHGDPTVVAAGAPVCETLAVAKRDLRAGEMLDGIGGFCAYGLIDNADAASGGLPIGVSDGCRMIRNVKRDAVVTYDDVELPPDRLVDRLRDEQQHMFSNDELEARVFRAMGEQS
jgi:predicted homoserine dehydrogenase-like protein